MWQTYVTSADISEHTNKIPLHFILTKHCNNNVETGLRKMYYENKSHAFFALLFTVATGKLEVM